MKPPMNADERRSNQRQKYLTTNCAY